MLLFSFLTALGFLIYIYNIDNGFHDIINAFITRSASWQVHPYYLWPLLWPAAIIVRFFIYFNPIFAAFSLITLVQLLKKIRSKQYSSTVMIFIGLFLFGLIHILLYPSGSFGHIYWIYYFIPYVSFSSASILVSLKRKPVILFIIFIFSLLLLLGIDKWKTGEIKGNLWRYNLDQQADKYLSPYESVYINKDSSLDGDVFKYKFGHETHIANPYMLSRTYKHYIYSCETTCDVTNKVLKYLLTKYAYKIIHSSQGEGYVFLLDKPAENNKSQITQTIKKSISTQPTTAQHSIFKQIYIFLVSVLQVPFL